MTSRRTIIGSIATTIVAANSGCVGGTMDSSSGDSENADDEAMTVTVGDYSIPKEREIEVQVSVVRQFTEQHPARLEIEVQNVADEKRHLRFGHTVPFSGFIGEHTDTDATLTLFPEDGQGYMYDDAPRRFEDGCWFPPDIQATESILRGERLESGEKVAKAYDLYVGLQSPPDSSGLEPAPTDADWCIDPGTYEFNTETFGAESTENLDKPWGFSLVIK